MKKCNKCKIEKPFSCFHKQEKGLYGLRGRCIPCVQEYREAPGVREKIRLSESKRRENPFYLQRRIDSLKKYRKSGKWKENQLRVNVKRYGLSVEDYRKFLVKQKHCCAICGIKTVKNLRVDHDHKTGKVRGLLCDGCNTSLGFMKENPRNLIKAAEYLIFNKGENT